MKLYTTCTTFLFPPPPPHFFFLPPHHQIPIVSLHHHHISIVSLHYNYQHYNHHQHHHISTAWISWLCGFSGPTNILKITPWWSSNFLKVYRTTHKEIERKNFNLGWDHSCWSRGEYGLWTIWKAIYYEWICTGNFSVIYAEYAAVTPKEK